MWLASYGVKNPGVPAPWTSWAAWQWTSSNRDPAISGHLVDDSYIADLGALVIPRPSIAKSVTKARARKAEPKPDSLPKT